MVTRSEVIDRIITGESDGLTVLELGGNGRFPGRSARAAETAARTSLRADWIFRSRSNCNTTLTEPAILTEVISVTPDTCPSWRSSGAATVAAMVAGSAPGRLALTWTTGKSTRGKGATGSHW